MAQQPKPHNFRFQLRKPNLALKDRIVNTTFDDVTAHNLDKIKGKVLELFPATKNRIYSLIWIHPEGDEITVSNSEELEIALKELTGPTLE